MRETNTPPSGAVKEKGPDQEEIREKDHLGELTKARVAKPDQEESREKKEGEIKRKARFSCELPLSLFDRRPNTKCLDFEELADYYNTLFLEMGGIAKVHTRFEPDKDETIFHFVEPLTDLNGFSVNITSVESGKSISYTIKGNEAVFRLSDIGASIENLHTVRVDLDVSISQE